MWFCKKIFVIKILYTDKMSNVTVQYFISAVCCWFVKIKQNTHETLMRVPLTPRSSLFDIPHLTRREDFMRQVPLLPCRLCRDPATVTFADLTHNFHSKYFFNKKYFALYSKLQTVFIKQIKLAPATTFLLWKKRSRVHL